MPWAQSCVDVCFIQLPVAFIHASDDAGDRTRRVPCQKVCFGVTGELSERPSETSAGQASPPPPALPMAVKCLLGILVRHVRESGRLLVRMPRIGRCWAQADVRPMIWPVIFYHKFGPHTSGTARLTEVENTSASSLRDLYFLILAATTLHVGN